MFFGAFERLLTSLNRSFHLRAHRVHALGDEQIEQIASASLREVVTKIEGVLSNEDAQIADKKLSGSMRAPLHGVCATREAYVLSATRNSETGTPAKDQDFTLGDRATVHSQCHSLLN